jgi:molecular chaperone GrpE
MELVRELIPVIDDFERAIKASTQSGEEGNSDQAGSRLIYNKMVKILSSKGLTPMDDLIGKDLMRNFMKPLHKYQLPLMT